jgi:porin
VGAFLRLGRQSETPEVDYKALYSGGLDFKGTAWGREGDNIGIGYTYLPGGSGDIAHSHVFETYYRLVVDEHLALTADVQYVADHYRDGDNPKGWIGGLRLTLEF